ncbi:MAG: hypothetical protein K2X39_04805 [Silvanigrellaceae bacterium]|nr:hypothetical protein [Silvanigrellaceae bacterium]
MLYKLTYIIEAFERLTIENKCYFCFVNSEKCIVEVLFEKKINGKNWSIWLKLNEKGSKRATSKHGLAKLLEAFHIEEQTFVKEISGVLLTQCAYANYFLHQVEDIFGKELVEKSIISTNHFIQDLQEALKITFDNNTTTTQAKSKAHIKAQLKIIS